MNVRIRNVSGFFAKLSLLGLFAIPVVMMTLSANAETIITDYEYANIMGGTGAEVTNAVATDSNNNVYVAGYFNGTVDFDPGAGTDNKTSAGGRDIFVTKINADGSYGYTKTMGGVGTDGANAVATDQDGNIYIASPFNGTADFDPGAGTDNKTSAGSTDIALTKINADGTYGYTKTIGDTGADTPYTLATDQGDNIYVAGAFTATVDFDPGAGTDNKTSAGGTDAFLTKINADSSYGYTKIIGGASADSAYAIATDQDNNVYIAARFYATADFDPGAGTDNKTSAGNMDASLTKINADGTYGYTKTIGGTAYDQVNSLATDQNNNVYIAGNFQGTADFDPGAGTDNKTATGGSDDGFVTRINADGSYGYSKFFGSTNNDNVYAVTTDQDGYIYLAGEYIGTLDFDPGAGTDIRTSVGWSDAFLTKMNADGTYVYAKTMEGQSGADESYGSSVASDSSNSIYLAGYFWGTLDFNPDVATDSKTSAGSSDVFLTKLTQTTYQQITGLAPSLAAKTLSNTDATDNTIENGTSATIRLSLSDTTPIADVTTTFTTDLNWSTVTADSNLTTGTAFAHNLTAADGTAGTFTLYVPKLPNHTRVGICPGASSLAATTEQCEGLYYLTEGVDNNLTTTTIDAQDYWTITGLTGTGGFSAEAAATTTDADTDTDALAETGESQTNILYISLIILGISIIRLRSRYSKA